MKAKVSASLSFDKKEKKTFGIVFGILSAFGLYSLTGLLGFFLAGNIAFLAKYFGVVFIILYALFFAITYMLVNQKVFKMTYMISSAILLLVYVLTVLKVL